TRRGLTLSAALAGAMLGPDASAAAVPTTLDTTTRRAAILFAGHQPMTGATTGRALALAEGGLKAMFLSRLLTMSGALLTVVVIGGVGLLAGLSARETRPEAAAPVEEPEKSRVDRQGDPLPPGVVARLGTQRYRTGDNGLHGVGFLADSKTIVSVTQEAHVLQFWEASSGKL